MSDHTSTASEIAKEKGCSTSTVNAKAKSIGIGLKNRSPEDHQRLMDALADVKPRKKIPAPSAEKKAGKKAKRPRKAKAAPAPNAALDLDSFFTQGKVYIKEIGQRLAALDKEKAELEAQLEKLLVLHPGMRK